MSDGEKRKISLTDGSTYEVGERQYEAISELRQAISNVARGVCHNLSIVQNDGGTTRQRLWALTGDGIGLMDVAEALINQSKIARFAAVEWEGNVPSCNRSYRDH